MLFEGWSYHILESIRLKIGGKAMKSLLMSCVLLGVLMGEYTYASIPQGRQQLEDSKVLSVRRQSALVKQWLEAGDSIFSKTKNPKAKEIMDFLWERGAIGVLTKKEIYLVILKNEVPVGKRIVLIATKEEDRNRDPYLEAVWSLGLDAFFDFEKNIILGKNLQEISTRWLGITLMRVGYHVLLLHQSPYNWKDFGKFCEKEMEARIFQHEIMERIGGDEYKKYIEKKSQWLKKVILGRGGQVGEDYSLWSEYDSEIDILFGPAKSEFERRSRVDTLWFHVHFHLFDQEFKEGSREQKIMFMKTLYQKKGWMES